MFRKINVNDVQEIEKRKEGRVSFRRSISEALGRKPNSLDLSERHPFDVEILRVPPKAIPYRYHSHSAQWEYYQVISGTAVVRHSQGEDRVARGDAFLFMPGEPHQFRNESEEDFVLLVIADNPIGESIFYPDEKMWIVTSPDSHYVVLHPEREDS